jgi:hypothetical protein
MSVEVGQVWRVSEGSPFMWRVVSKVDADGVVLLQRVGGPALHPPRAIDAAVLAEHGELIRLAAGR